MQKTRPPPTFFHRSKLLSTSANTATATVKHPVIAGLEKEASLAGSGRSSPVRLEDSEGLSTRLSSLTVASSVLSRQPSSAKDLRSRDKSREYLKQCLQEISYLTSASTLNPLLDRSSTMFSNSAIAGIPRPKKSMSEEVAAQTETDDVEDPVAATSAQSAAVGTEAASTAAAQMLRTSGGVEDWGKFGQAGQQGGLDSENARNAAAFGSEEESHVRAKRLMRDSGPLSVGGSVDEELLSREADAASEELQRWKLKRLLTHHRSAVKAVAFDGAGVTLVSASSDKTLRLVRLDSAHPSLKQIGDAVTLRGHSKVVTSVAISAAKRRVFSGSLDSTLNVWALEQTNSSSRAAADEDEGNNVEDGQTQTPLASVKTDSQVFNVTLLPHPGSDDSKDAVLATASADGLVRLYRCCDQSGEEPVFLRSFDYFGLGATGDEVEKERESLRQEAGGLPLPTSLCSFHSNLKDCAVAFSNAIVKTFRIDTGEETAKLKFDQSYDGTPGTQVNVVVSHPTLPLLLTGHEDKFLRIVDAFAGKLVSSLHAHKDAVTTLDVDPAGLKLLSGGQDGAVRIWDIAKLAAPFAGGSPAQRAQRQTKRTAKARANGGAGEDEDTSTTAMSAGTDGGTGDEPETTTERSDGDGSRSSVEGGWDEYEEEEDEGCVELFQEFGDHVRATSSGQGVLAVRYHQSLPYFATAGADGAVRIYG